VSTSTHISHSLEEWEEEEEVQCCRPSNATSKATQRIPTDCPGRRGIISVALLDCVIAVIVIIITTFVASKSRPDDAAPREVEASGGKVLGRRFGLMHAVPEDECWDDY
jgi:hypothetical protein